MSMNLKDYIVLQRQHSWAQEEWIIPLSKAIEGLTASQAAWIPPVGGLTMADGEPYELLQSAHA
ncbi:hypothetical protein D3C74_07680 [compost metagenome]